MRGHFEPMKPNKIGGKQAGELLTSGTPPFTARSTSETSQWRRSIMKRNAI